MKARTAGRQRKLQRNVHLLAGALLLGYVYAPAPSRVQELVRFIVFPLLVATGIAMWQAPRIRRLRKSAGSRLPTRSRRAPVLAGHQSEQHRLRAASMS
jgi:hypothetical protein